MRLQGTLESERALREQERQSSAEKLALLEQAGGRLAEVFKGASAEALDRNSRQFLELAKAHLERHRTEARQDLEARQRAIGELVAPMRESLERFRSQTHELEKERASAYEGLKQRIHSLMEQGQHQREETARLSAALRSPGIRGRWGELQLRRTAELAGMQDHCDFSMQQSVYTEDGRRQPDMIVHLPGGGQVAVDAKAPLDAYLKATEAQDEDSHARFLDEHAARVRQHVVELSKKEYWRGLDPAAAFVILYLPGEALYTAALQRDPELLATGVEKRVFLAGPTTLIALLNAIGHSWREERLARNAQEISRHGGELYKRIATLAAHWSRLGKHLGQAVTSYNQAVGSLESRVLSAARRFRDLGAAADAERPIERPPALDGQPRRLQAAELLTAPLPGTAEAERDEREPPERVARLSEP